MLPRRLFTKIFASHLLVLLVLCLAAGIYVNTTFQRVYLSQLHTELEEIGTLIGERLPESVWLRQAELPAGWDSGSAHHPSLRLSIILPDGQVLADSHQEASKMENHLDREEIKQALTSGSIASATRFSHTIQEDLLYVAIPVVASGKTLGIVRTARPVTVIRNELRAMRKNLLFGGAVILLLAAALSYFLSRVVAAPIEQMRVAATKFADGEYESRLSAPHTEELGALARALNRVGARINEKLREITRQRNELNAVLSSMVEGVIALDLDERIISMNYAAERMFDVSFAELRGRSIQAAIRNSDFEKLVREVRSLGVTVQKDIILYRDGDRRLEAHGTMLRDSSDAFIGVLIVMNDVTQLRRLEKIRSDFVANVSHELKTPITSIRGFIETLIDGAKERVEERDKFLTIIKRQTERLQKIIDDLLSLSEIEQQEERGGLSLESARVASVVDAAARVCSDHALAKKISIERNVPGELIALINPSLLEQALVNLIDNAIKYSEQGRMVQVIAKDLGNEVVISVHDQGPGISRAHQERVFERFYRVDEGRSRKEGGSGLGLAIVKHIAHVHGGRATVESMAGHGSTFSLYLRKPSSVNNESAARISAS